MIPPRRARGPLRRRAGPVAPAPVTDRSLRRRPRPSGCHTAATTPRRITARSRKISSGDVPGLTRAWSTELGMPGHARNHAARSSNGVLYATGPWSIVFALDARTGAHEVEVGPEAADDRRPAGCAAAPSTAASRSTTAGLRRPARRPAGRARREHRQPVWDVQTSIDLTEPLHDHRRAAHRQGQGDHRQRRRRDTACAATSRPTTPRPASWRGASTPCRAIRRSRFERPELAMAAQDLDRRVVEDTAAAAPSGTRMAYDPELDLALHRHRQRRAVEPQHPQPRRRRQPVPRLDRRPRRPDTGEYAWHYQTTPGDNWDYTADAADDPRRPAHRRPHAQGDDAGAEERVLLRARSRSTGEFISAVPFTPTNWATGLDLETGRPDRVAAGPLRPDASDAHARARPARTTGIRCRSIPAPGSCTFRCGPTRSSHSIDPAYSQQGGPQPGRDCRSWVRCPAAAAKSPRRRRTCWRGTRWRRRSGGA